MFIPNQKKSSRSSWNASEQRRNFSTLLEQKEKKKKGWRRKRWNGDDLVARAAIQAFVFVIVGMTICQPYLEKSNDSCSPERAPEKPYFTWYQWREKKAHLRGDVLMVHIKTDVAAAGLVNQDHRPSCLTSTWCADSLSNASLLTLTSVCVCVCGFGSHSFSLNY